LCFSAEASFGVAGLLVPAGVYCLQKAARRNLALLPLSAIPILFSVQQFSEGFVWLGLARGNAEQVRFASLGFLFFGLMFWLFWIPASVAVSETRGNVKLLLGVVALIGLAGGLTLFVPLILDPEVLTTVVENHSIRYMFESAPGFAMFPREAWQLFYVAVVATPLLVTKAQGFGGFSILLVLSAVISQVFYWYAFVSVWCFFAALLSINLCNFFRKLPSQQT
jgi:hypothetical protein